MRPPAADEPAERDGDRPLERGEVDVCPLRQEPAQPAEQRHLARGQADRDDDRGEQPGDHRDDVRHGQLRSIGDGLSVAGNEVAMAAPRSITPRGKPSPREREDRASAPRADLGDDRREVVAKAIAAAFSRHDGRAQQDREAPRRS